MSNTMKRLSVLLSILLTWNISAFSQEADDPYFWLEEVEGAEPLVWVAAHNEKTISALRAHPSFDAIYQKNLEIYNSDERMTDVRICGDYVYDLLQDETHERGIWRRSSLDSYVHGRPEWEVLLNLDNLAKSEGKNWAFGGAQFLSPACTRCMVRLSDRGADANEMREFDVEWKTFVREGFHVPLSRSILTWKDMNTLYVATDFDKGNMSQSGYPHEIRIWKRGTPLEEARILFKGDTTDIYAYPMVIQGQQRTHEMIVQLRGDGDRRIFSVEDGKLVRLEVPSGSTDICHVGDQMVVLLRSDWQIGDKTFPQGALISINYDDFLNGDRTFDIIEAPDARSHIWYHIETNNFLLVGMLHDASSVLYRYRFQHGKWIPERISTPVNVNIVLMCWDVASNRFFFSCKGFLQPRTLYYVGEEGTVERVQNERAFFNPESFVVRQHDTISRDGTRVPYFIVEPRDMKHDGTNPMLVYGYGGFGTPRYPGTIRLSGQLGWSVEVCMLLPTFGAGESSALLGICPP